MAATLEERVAVLEGEVARLTSVVATGAATPERPWWEKISGTFDNDPLYDEAMALGRAYRESQRPLEENILDANMARD